MAVLIEGTEPIEVREVLLTASDRLADFMQQHPDLEDSGSIMLCVALRRLGEGIKPFDMTTELPITE